MNKLLLIILLCLSITGFSQIKKINIGIVDTLHSNILNDIQEIWVHVPTRPKEHEVFAPKRYPVIYVLDGDWHFQSVTGMASFLSTDFENGAGTIPEVIVVGILSKNRTRDLTPTNITKLWNGKEEKYLRHSGGGEKFSDYIEKELITYIDSHYPTAPYRMLIGHSFGGLFAVNTLVSKPELFNSYCIIDPSLWWDSKLLLKKTISPLQQGKLRGKNLFVALADTVLVLKESGGNTAHISANSEFINLLEKYKSSGFTYNWKYYQEETHTTVPFKAGYDALRVIFKHKPLPIPENGVSDPTFDATFVKHHYMSVSSQIGYKVLPPEYMVNNLGLGCMYRNLMDKAYGFFQSNIDNYPQSFNAYNSMGSYYEKKGNKKKAIENYTKALSIKAYPDTQNKLMNLKNNK